MHQLPCAQHPLVRHPGLLRPVSSWCTIPPSSRPCKSNCAAGAVRVVQKGVAGAMIEAVFSLPGQPRGRGRVERFFATVNQRLLSDLPGYAPAGQTKRPPALTLGALDHAFRRFVLDAYHQHPHSTTGVPPQARWSHGTFFLTCRNRWSNSTSCCWRSPSPAKSIRLGSASRHCAILILPWPPISGYPYNQREKSRFHYHVKSMS